MQIVGLTGSIAMGKSHAARMFKRFGVPVFDSDAAVHALFRAPSPLPVRIAATFGDVLDDAGHIDRRRLSEIVIGDETRLRELERLVHPAVYRAQRDFLAQAARQRFRQVVLDVPLLFEGGRTNRFDAVLTVACSPALQRQRAMSRTGMTMAKFEAIVRKQLPVADKRKRADRVIASGFDRGQTYREVASALHWLETVPAEAWPHRWI